MNDKYNADNYKKYNRINVSGDNATVSEQLSSNNLLIKWHCQKSFITIPRDSYKVAQDKNSVQLIYLTGNCDKKVSTPIGELFPENFKFKIAIDNDKLIQFLELPKADYPYYLHFNNPANLKLSFVEIWEFSPILTG